VATRVVSAPRPGEVVLDAGTKALSSDKPPWLTGHGLLVEAPEATIAALSEEHAVVHGVETDLAVGDLVRVIPNHVCSVVNLISELVVVSDGAVTDRWPVSVRRLAKTFPDSRTFPAAEYADCRFVPPFSPNRIPGMPGLRIPAEP
jgi:hypothetical protein